MIRANVLVVWQFPIAHVVSVVLVLIVPLATVSVARPTIATSVPKGAPVRIVFRVIVSVAKARIPSASLAHKAVLARTAVVLVMAA
jgi:hypothetical protein